jgi:GT2 family glycosyltransferase
MIRIMKKPQSDGVQRISYPPYLAHAGGSSLGIKRSVHERVGGFDESLMALEDTDYCFRVQLKGIELHFLADAVIHYRYRHHLADLFCQSRLWAEYNVLMYKRYREEKRVARPWRRYLLGCKTLIQNSPRLVNKDGRPGWVRTLGTQVGLLQGAIKHKVPPGILSLFWFGAERLDTINHFARQFFH